MAVRTLPVPIRETEGKILSRDRHLVFSGKLSAVCIEIRLNAVIWLNDVSKLGKARIPGCEQCFSVACRRMCNLNDWNTLAPRPVFEGVICRIAHADYGLYWVVRGQSIKKGIAE
jgi:hypothetical protein